jgi:hypothetical protein
MGHKQGKHAQQGVVVQNMNNDQLDKAKAMFKSFAHTKGKVGKKDWEMLLFDIPQHVSKLATQGSVNYNSVPGTLRHFSLPFPKRLAHPPVREQFPHGRRQSGCACF